MYFLHPALSIGQVPLYSLQPILGRRRTLTRWLKFLYSRDGVDVPAALLDVGPDAAEEPCVDVIIGRPHIGRPASGTSAATDHVKGTGPKSINFVCILAAPEGLANLHKSHRDVPTYAAAIDERLDERGCILPGLGETGDRMFGPKEGLGAWASIWPHPLGVRRVYKRPPSWWTVR